MCDTFVVMPGSSKNKKLWFAKNSDRSPNEPNLIINQPAKKNDLSACADVSLTYISIPQAEETHALLMVKPVWTWGCEMGVNEHGVCIGNEAVFTKGKYPETGLIGMDICRLVLERCSSSLEGMKLIGSLVEQYGQGGNCGFDEAMYYNNSFIVADASQAYVVETVGYEWAAKNIEGVYAISNSLTIEREWDFSCGSLENTAKKYDFSKAHSDTLRTHFSGASLRRYMIYQTLLNAKDGAPRKNIYSILLGDSFIKRDEAPGIDYDICKDALRAHIPSGGFVDSPCMHYGGPIGGHTTGSLIVCPKDGFISLTGGSTPCKAVFKPFLKSAELPFSEDEQQAELYWLRRELIQRNILAGNIDNDEYLRECITLEQELDSLLLSFAGQNSDGFNQRVFNMENDFVQNYLSGCKRDAGALVPKKGSFGYKKRWNKKNAVLLERIAELGI